MADECTRVLNPGVPQRTVSFPWGDVAYPWPGGRTLCNYDCGVDESVFVMLDEFCGASLDGNDDPTWDQAIKGNDSQLWWDSGYEELANLDRFDVIDPVAADAIGDDEDIYDTR